MHRKIAFLTNAREYAAPPTAAALGSAGWDVFCHDDSFASAATRESYAREHPGQHLADAQDATMFVEEGLARYGRIDALISNDIPKGTAKPLPGRTDGPSCFEVGDLLDDFEAHLDSLVAEPVRLLRAALPAMRAQQSGSVVLITSGAPLRVPMARAPHGYLAARAAANLLAKSLAVELASYNIQVNAVAPYLVYSQTFFPSELGPEDPKYAPLIDTSVPMGRFGAPEEIGALVAHLASGGMSFVSGQVIAFSGAGC